MDGRASPDCICSAGSHSALTTGDLGDISVLDEGEPARKTRAASERPTWLRLDHAGAGENGMLIAGHGRLEAAKLEGITEVPTIVARGYRGAVPSLFAAEDRVVAGGC